MQSSGYKKSVKAASESSPQATRKTQNQAANAGSSITNQPNMIGHKLLMLALVAGILTMQFSPVWTRHTRTGETDNTTPAPTTLAPDAGPQVDFICLINFGIATVFELVTACLGAVGACLPCDQGAGPCIACFAALIPQPPLIPLDCFSQ